MLTFSWWWCGPSQEEERLGAEGNRADKKKQRAVYDKIRNLGELKEDHSAEYWRLYTEALEFFSTPAQEYAEDSDEDAAGAGMFSGMITAATFAAPHDDGVGVGVGAGAGAGAGADAGAGAAARVVADTTEGGADSADDPVSSRRRSVL